jgi:hypothetical protein
MPTCLDGPSPPMRIPKRPTDTPGSRAACQQTHCPYPSSICSGSDTEGATESVQSGQHAAQPPGIRLNEHLEHDLRSDGLPARLRTSGEAGGGGGLGEMTHLERRCRGRVRRSCAPLGQECSRKSWQPKTPRSGVPCAAAERRARDYFNSLKSSRLSIQREPLPQ